MIARAKKLALYEQWADAVLALEAHMGTCRDGCTTPGTLPAELCAAGIRAGRYVFERRAAALASRKKEPT